MQKKGQAAMEFLMTYGWAILAAIIVIGILGVYFFRSDIMTPKGAIVGAPFYVNAQNVKPGGITLEIKNNGGESYNVTAVTLTSATVGGADAGTSGTCDAGTTVPSMINAGSSTTFMVTCGLSADNVGQTFKGDITITYRKAGSSVDLTSTGTITEAVVA